jgi:3-hydroxyisobutyrate dehydrogenase-like beta-hydroxyacid dehydrogenase
VHEPIGLVGVGRMGEAMGLNLLRAGYPLRVWNRTAEKARPLVEQGAQRVAGPAEAVEPGGIVLSMVADDRALEEVSLGEMGLLSRLGTGGIHVSMSTVSPRLSRKLAPLHQERGAQLVASPVFGKPEVAARARLWILCAGAAEARQRVRPILEILGQRVFDIGDEPAAANVLKLAGNFLIGSAVEAMAEAFTLAQKHGMDRRTAHELFSQTLFDCFVYREYGKLVASEKYQPVGASPSLIRKDYRLVLEAAEDALVPMPLARLIHERLTATVAKGRDDVDWSGFAREVSEAAGVDSGGAGKPAREELSPPANSR